MGFFSHQGIVRSGQIALDRAISDLELKATPNGVFLVSTSGANGGLASFEIEANGTLDLVDTHFFGAAQARLGSSQIRALDIGGTGYVFTSMIGSQNLIGQVFSGSGALGATSRIAGFSGKTGAMAALEDITLPGGHFLYAAKHDGNGVDAYRLSGSAHHLSGASVTDSAQTYASGIADLSTATIGGRTFLLTLSGREHGISSFEIGSNGSLTHSGRLGAQQGLGVNAPTDLETVSAYGSTYAVIASAGSSSLTVLKLNNGGSFERADHILDTLHTRFAGVTAVETVKVNGQVYVLAGGADDGLSLFVMLPDGRLQHLESIAQTNSNSLGNIQDMVATRIGSDIQVYAASGTSPGISQLTVDLPTLGSNLIGGSGNDRLNGTADAEVIFGGDGNDTLHGGFGDDYIVDGPGTDSMTGSGGADVFVLSYDRQPDRILDFQPYRDWIDLRRVSDAVFLQAACL